MRVVPSRSETIRRAIIYVRKYGRTTVNRFAKKYILPLVAFRRLYKKTNQSGKVIETCGRLFKLDFDLKDKVREGVEKLKKRAKESNKGKNHRCSNLEKS